MTAPAPDDPLAVLLDRASRGDVDAAGEVYDDTITAVWRLALATAETPEGASRTVRTAYARLFTEGVADAPRAEDVLITRVHARALTLVHRTATAGDSLGLSGEAAQHRGRRFRRSRRLPARALRAGA